MFNSAKPRLTEEWSKEPCSWFSIPFYYLKPLPITFFPVSEACWIDHTAQHFHKGKPCVPGLEDISIFIYICFKAHTFPCPQNRRTYLTGPLAMLCAEYSAPNTEYFAGKRGVGKKSLWAKKSSSQVVWEGRIQGSGHTERARLGAKRLPPNDLKNKKWTVLKQVEEAKELLICIQAMLNVNISASGNLGCLPLWDVSSHCPDPQEDSLTLENTVFLRMIFKNLPF